MAIAQIQRQVPTLRSRPVVGAAFELRDDYLGLLLRASREVGDVAMVNAGPPGWRISFISVSTPDLVMEILGNPDRFRKDNQFYREVRAAFGNGMLTSQDEVWRRQRRFAAPMFTPKRIATTYAAAMVEECRALTARWGRAAAAGETLDVRAEMTELTSRIIGRILFGADMTAVLPEIMRFRFVNDALLKRGFTPHPAPMWVPTAANRNLSSGLALVRTVVDRIIAERRASSASAQTRDLLGMLLNARDSENTADRMGDSEVADQVLIFLLAGHDTTASTLACLLVELARVPEWQRLVKGEVDEVLQGRATSAEDIPRLPWTMRAVREAMRLYPAAHSVGRNNVQDEVLNGYHIPAGSALVVSPWTIHRSPRIWRDPDVFDPRRFDLPDGVFPGGHKYAWFPFGAGPHACIGMQIAMLEAPIALATILQSFSLSTSLTSIPLKAAVSLHPASPLPVRVRPAAE